MTAKSDTAYLTDACVLITGGTGSLGRQLTRMLLDAGVRRIVIFSRDEFKQFVMREEYDAADRERLRFFLGDVRDEARLRRAMAFRVS